MQKKRNLSMAATKFACYRRELEKLVQPDWVKDHEELVKAWWLSGIVGGMFRAGWKAAKRHG